LEDEKGFLWLSCHLGIVRVNKQDLNDFAAGRISLITSSHFGKAEGLLSDECSRQGQPTGFKARDGKLWFPTAQGLAVVDQKVVTFNRQPPPVVVEGLTVDGHTMDFRAGLTIKPGQQNLEIQYTALSFVKPQQIRFRYKVEGLDPNWINAGTRRTAHYSRIPPGTYTFRVIAANSDGIWSTNGAHLALHILPPFYSTWWFRLMSMLTLAGLLYLTWRWRTAQWERKQAAQRAFSRELLASQERERKRIAAGQADFVVMDVGSNHPDGIAATEQIKAMNPAARIILVSDYDDAVLRESARHAGACAYVLKDNLLEIGSLLREFSNGSLEAL